MILANFYLEEVYLDRTRNRRMFNRCSVSISNSTFRNYGEGQPLSHQCWIMAGWSYCGLKTSFLNFMLEKLRSKLRKGSQFYLALSFESEKVTSPTPYFSTSWQSDRRSDSPSLNYTTSSSEPSFLVDLSVMEMRGSMAKIAIQFSESTRNLSCLGSMKQTMKMLAFSLELKSTLSRVVKSPLMHLTPLICSYISKRILIQFDQYYQQKASGICICTCRPYNYYAYCSHLKWLIRYSLSVMGHQLIKLKMIRENSTASNFQKKFSHQEALRRNKNYYDILKLNEQQHLDQQRRRMPMNKKQISSKIQKTFQSAKKETNTKLDDQIEKFKFRLSFYESKNLESESTRYDESAQEGQREKSPREIKGVPLDKHISRESIYRRKNKPIPDERQFTNFYITNHELDQIPSIGKYSPRNSNIAHSHMTDLYYNSQKKYEEVYFDNKTTSCIFNLKKQNDAKQRYFFVPKREEDKPATDLNPEHVAKSFSVANPYKTSKILHFYKLNGRQLPSQYDERFLSPNKNFYKDRDGRLVKQQMSFTSRKYRDELLFRDLDQIKKSKKPYFQRDQICDERYFKQEKKSFDAKHQQ